MLVLALSLAVAAIASATTLPPPEPATAPTPGSLSGDYEDEGIIAQGAAADFPGGVSLGALLSAEFEPALVRKLHAQIAKVRLQQGESLLKAWVYDHDGAVLRQGRWNRDAQSPGRDYLYFRINDEQVVLILETAGEGRMLKVTLQRSAATALGPAFRTVGIFLFHRL